MVYVGQKRLHLKSNFELKIEDWTFVSFNDQSVAFRLLIEEVQFVLSINESALHSLDIFTSKEDKTI